MVYTLLQMIVTNESNVLQLFCFGINMESI